MDCFDHREFCLPDVLHVVDVAKFLGLREKTVYLYVREGKIRAIRCGRSYRIRREWVEEYIRSASPKDSDVD